MKRIVKQIIVLVIVIVVIGGLIWGVIWLTRTKPTCFDGIKNGEEEGLDCGGVCGISCPTQKPEAKPLIVKNLQVVSGGDKCDVVATINNPNGSLGAQHIPYTLTWGSVKKQGEFFIYPSEERYLAEMNLPCQNADQAQLEAKDPPEWKFFSGFEKPNLEISNSVFNYLDNSYEYAEVSGIITNHSPFDLKEVQIFAIVKDTAGSIIAINRTTVNTLNVGQKREFRIFWTHPFAKNGIGSFYTTSNLFDSANFVKSYSAESGKWQTDSQNNSNSNINSN
jgi:hypothetical protein